MSAVKSPNSANETIVIADEAQLRDVVRQAYEDETPLYPIGGGTSLDYGVAARKLGMSLAMTGLNRVIDYPSRDMTITVEAGITMESLAATLAEERQRLPIDAAQATTATLGGVVATNFSGPRRFGYGTIRDYVIGISGVDGRGVSFKGGGRVVKNVAGYDFCKLLTGSMGTLAIITQVTLKLKPIPEASAFLTCQVDDLSVADELLAALVTSKTTPTAIELVAGPKWDDEQLALSAGKAGRLVIGLEGTKGEVDWMVEQLSSEWHQAEAPPFLAMREPLADRVWSRLVEFAAGDSDALVLKFSVLPGAVTKIIRLLVEIDPRCSIQAHAANGIVLARFTEFAPADVSRVLIGRLQPAAAEMGGSVVVWSCPGSELTRQAVWGGSRDELRWMRAVKQQFDPRDLLNPGRFVYGSQ